MQDIGLTALVLFALAGATALVLRRIALDGHASRIVQAGLGAMMGLLGLFVVLVLGVDVIPDQMETPLEITFAIVGTLLIAAIGWLLTRP